MHHHMTRLLRILFHAGTIISLAFCIFFAALWLRSYVTPDALAWRRIDGDGSLWIDSIHSTRGRIGLEGEGYWIDPDKPRPRTGLTWSSGSSFWLPPGWDPTATIPYWHLLMYFGALPLWWCVRRLASLAALQNRRRKRGLCSMCGYDLRASCGRCPECGMADSLAPAFTNLREMSDAGGPTNTDARNT